MQTFFECTGNIITCGCTDCQYDRRQQWLDHYGFMESEVMMDDDGDEYVLDMYDFTSADGGEVTYKKLYLQY